MSDPAAIVKKAIAAQGTLKSATAEIRMSITMKTPQSLEGTSLLYQGEGQFEAPDKSKLVLKSSSGQLEIITVGDREYTKAPGSQAWTQKKKTSTTRSSAATPADVAGYLKNTRNLQLVDTSGGSYHLTFDLDMQKYSEVSGVPGIDPAAFKGQQAKFEVWVNQKTFYVERVKMEFKGKVPEVVGGGELAVSMDIEFADFDKPVSIEVPI